MKQMNEIDKYIGQIHKKFMNTKTTPEEHMTRDLWFSMNLMQLAYNNLKRWSLTTSKPSRNFKITLKNFLDEQNKRGNKWK